MKKIGCLLLACACALGVWGQEDTAAQKKEINKVKKSSQYLYGEATMATQEEAAALAEELLHENINQWVAEQKKLNQANKVVVMNTKQLWGNIALPRGNMFRAFYYVRKADILPAENTEVIKKEERQPEGQGTKVEPITGVQAWSPVVTEIADIGDFSKLQVCLSRLKAEGKVRDFHKYAALTDKDAYYLIVYNKEGKIEAVLSKGPSRRNVKTGQADGVENYSGRGAIGFRVNE